MSSIGSKPRPAKWSMWPQPPAGWARTSSRSPSEPTGRGERDARRAMRTQIARLEAALGELEAGGSPRAMVRGGSGAARLAGLAELERTRDELVAALAESRRAASRTAARREATRALLERAIADPRSHRWLRIRSEALGEPGCRHWHVVPRLGLVGMLAGWWRVKVSSGCPLPCRA